VVIYLESLHQISAGLEYSVMDIAKKCIEVAGNDVPINVIDYRPGEKGMRECFDITKAKSVLGYQPKVGLDEGLELMLRWAEEELGFVRSKN